MRNMLTVYGIPNCDTVKKARDWLADNKIAYDFHDYKVSGIDASRLKVWSKALGWEKVLNRASTTFKALPDVEKEDLNEVRAIKLMLAQPSMIKRPVFDINGSLFVGFKPGSADRLSLERALT